MILNEHEKVELAKVLGRVIALVDLLVEKQYLSRTVIADSAAETKVNFLHPDIPARPIEDK